MALLSLRDYARHRGCSLAGVQKAIASGRITVAREETRGAKVYKFIDADQADQQWAAKTDPVQQRVATRREMGKEDSPPLAPSVPSGPPPEQTSLFPEIAPHPTQSPGTQSKNAVGAGGEDYQRARAQREIAEAKLAELKVLEQMKRLVDITLLQPKLFNLAATVHQNMMNIPYRVSALLHARACAYVEELKTDPTAEWDEKEVQDILAGEITQALEQIADGNIRATITSVT